MNKKLRRLLRGRSSSKNNTALQQNSKETAVLSSLLAERSSSKQNYYFRTGNTDQDEADLKKDEKLEDKSILIVQDAEEEIITKNSSDIELSLEPMDSETVTVQLNPIVNNNDCHNAKTVSNNNFNQELSTESHPRTNAFHDRKSNSNEAEPLRVINLPKQGPEKLEVLSLLTKSPSKNENPYSVSPQHLPTFKENAKNEKKTSTKETNSDSILSGNIDSSFVTKAVENSFNLPTSKSSSEISGLVLNQSALPPQSTLGRRSPTFDMATPVSCARQPLDELTKPLQHIPIQIKTLKDLTTVEDLADPGPPKVHIPEIIISTNPSLPNQTNPNWSSQNIIDMHHLPASRTCGHSARSFAPKAVPNFSTHSPHHHCSNNVRHQSGAGNHTPLWHHNPCHLTQHSSSRFLHTNHRQETPCHSAFPPRQGCTCHGHCFYPQFQECSCWNECRFPVKRQFHHHDCSVHRACSLRVHREVPKPTPSVIVISFPGKTHQKTIELPDFGFGEEQESTYPSVAMECESTRSQPHFQKFRSCKRHLEEICCADYDQHCDRIHHMAPSVTFLSSLQETHNFDAHCPCCHQMIHQHHRTTIAEECKMLSESHFATHSYLNCNEASNSIQNTLGHFEISPRSYTKLLAYIESTRAIAKRRRSPGNHFESRSSFHGFEHRSFASNNELHFLNRKPIHATNDYSSMGEQLLNSTIYQNQTIADTLQLARVLERAEECPWYWGEISNVEAKQILRGAPEGTFILRDSSDPRFLFSVSVMTARGPTSIRVVYTDGYFRFDSDGDKTSATSRKSSTSNEMTEIPRHRQCVIHMILHYTAHLSTKNKKSIQNTTFQANSDTSASSSGDINENLINANGTNEQCQFMCSWMGRSGKKVMPVSISQPLTKGRPSSLKQLSRACINKHLTTWKTPEQIEKLPLGPAMQKYIRKYPYPV